MITPLFQSVQHIKKYSHFQVGLKRHVLRQCRLAQTLHRALAMVNCIICKIVFSLQV